MVRNTIWQIAFTHNWFWRTFFHVLQPIISKTKKYKKIFITITYFTLPDFVKSIEKIKK